MNQTSSPTSTQAKPGVRHSYPVAVQRADLGTAFGLLLKTLPYALARLAVLVGCTLAAVAAWLIAFGGAAFLGKHIGGPAALVWLVLCAMACGGVWRFALRYVLYVAKCGHIAVLTELLTHGRIGNGSEGMFAYGKRVVTERFVEVNVLFAIDALVKSVVNAFNRTIDWVADLLPIPGLDGVMQIVHAVVRAATSYIDETIFSYRLARGDPNPWDPARDGLVYYCQNAREVLKTAVWLVVLDKVLTAAAWAAFLVPGFLLAAMVPGKAAVFAIGLGLLLALNFRSAFLKPLFLIMVMTKFHVSVRDQAIDGAWDARLTEASEKFREIAENARGWAAGARRPTAEGGVGPGAPAEYPPHGA